jgi:hypothetical protein
VVSEEKLIEHEYEMSIGKKQADYGLNGEKLGRT